MAKEKKLKADSSFRRKQCFITRFYCNLIRKIAFLVIAINGVEKLRAKN